jgi:hypothetical protein
LLLCFIGLSFFWISTYQNWAYNFRDDKIVSFKEQLIQLERDHNEDIGKLNMQMAAVLDDKDHQIKVKIRCPPRIFCKIITQQ